MSETDIKVGLAYFVLGAFAVLFVLTWAAILTLFERRQSAYSQDRLGPTRAHFVKLRGKPFILFGLFHVAADALKMFFKEPFVPAKADKALFLVAPVIGFVTSVTILALVPFGPDYTAFGQELRMQIARIDAGVLVVFAIGSLGIYGAALAGWASNNRFGLLGGLRAAAQGVSYEIALGLTVVGALIAYGTTELYAITQVQAATHWGFVLQPLGAVLFLTAGIAETKRAPFDMPEGESEIIGYFVEYSSMNFGLFMLGEFIEIAVLACLFVTLFLGGCYVPGILTPQGLADWLPQLGSVGVAIVGVAIFLFKVVMVSLLQLQIRWTLPRVRYDQLMRLGWKSLLPLSLGNIFVTAILIWFDPSLEWLSYVGFAMMALFALVVFLGPRRQEPTPVTSHG